VGLSSSELAEALGVSAGRVSQYVSAGKLEGCFQGDGRARRFDLALVAQALGRKLDQGQMMGNGAATRKALKAIVADPASPLVVPRHPAGATALPQNDPDLYEQARTSLVQEKARQAKRDNLVAEGRFVLAAEVERQVAKAVGFEVRQFEQVLREGARAVADDLGADVRVVRKILTDAWRAHRQQRAGVLEAEAEAVTMTDTEQAEDV
jgi:transcriptional regulator with XRE-family HTH domain